MADLLNTQERKCGLRRDLQSRLLLWCFIIQCSLSVPSVSARCQGIEGMSLTVYPEGIVNVQYGKPLELFCEDDKYTADDLEFRMGGVPYSSEQVNGTARRLYVEMPQRGVYIYYCVNKISKKHCPTRVIIDSAPQTVKDFGCKSENLDELTCTWTGESISVLRFSLSFIINGMKTEPCTTRVDKGSSQYQCSWTVNTLPRYRQHLKQLFFTLTSSNGFGSNEQNFTVDHYSIVRPAPVSNLKILKNNTHSVLLQWTIPNNMVDFMPNGVEHKIEYQIAKIDNSSYFRSVDASSLVTKNRTCRLLLSLPYAHMQYEVRVAIRPVEATGDEFWSRFTFLVFETTGISIHEINRKIYVNWRRNMKKPVPTFRRKLWTMKAQKTLNRNWLKVNDVATALGLRLDDIEFIQPVSRIP